MVSKPGTPGGSCEAYCQECHCDYCNEFFERSVPPPRSPYWDHFPAIITSISPLKIRFDCYPGLEIGRPKEDLLKYRCIHSRFTTGDRVEVIEPFTTEGSESKAVGLAIRGAGGRKTKTPRGCDVTSGGGIRLEGDTGTVKSYTNGYLFIQWDDEHGGAVQIIADRHTWANGLKLKLLAPSPGRCRSCRPPRFRKVGPEDHRSQHRMSRADRELDPTVMADTVAVALFNAEALRLERGEVMLITAAAQTAWLESLSRIIRCDCQMYGTCAYARKREQCEGVRLDKYDVETVVLVQECFNDHLSSMPVLDKFPQVNPVDGTGDNTGFGTFRKDRITRLLEATLGENVQITPDGVYAIKCRVRDRVEQATLHVITEIDHAKTPLVCPKHIAAAFQKLWKWQALPDLQPTSFSSVRCMMGSKSTKILNNEIRFCEPEHPEWALIPRRVPAKTYNAHASAYVRRLIRQVAIVNYYADRSSNGGERLSANQLTTVFRLLRCTGAPGAGRPEIPADNLKPRVDPADGAHDNTCFGGTGSSPNRGIRILLQKTVPDVHLSEGGAEKAKQIIRCIHENIAPLIINEAAGEKITGKHIARAFNELHTTWLINKAN